MATDFVSEASALSQKMDPILAQADAFEVKTEDDAAEASVLLAKLKTSHDAIEQKRTSFTAPLNQSLKEINGFFKPITDALTKSRKSLGDKILAWKKAENERIAKEEARRQKISDAAAEKRGEENTKVIEVDRVESTVGLSTTRKGPRKFRVIDFDKIPAEFKTVDEVKLNAFIRNKDNYDVAIPGIEVYQEDILSTRGF